MAQQPSPKQSVEGSNVKNPSFLADRATAASAASDALPASCPVCKSASIITTAKKPCNESYWRCEKCGEVWNNARRQSSRYSSF